jgi:hypothetical protein
MTGKDALAEPDVLVSPSTLPSTAQALAQGQDSIMGEGAWLYELFSISKRIQESMDPLPGHGIKKNEQGKDNGEIPVTPPVFPKGLTTTPARSVGSEF